MEESTILSVLEKFGLPTLIIIVLLVVLLKYIPKVISLWEVRQQKQQEYYDSLQKSNVSQVEVMNSISREMIAVIERSNQVIERNNLMVDRNTAAFEKTITCSEHIVDCVAGIKTLLHDHDRRAERMNIDIAVIKENVV